MWSLAEFDSNFDPTEAMVNRVKVITAGYEAARGHKPENVWDHWQFEVAGKLYRVGYCSYTDAIDDARQVALHRGTDTVTVLA